MDDAMKANKHPYPVNAEDLADLRAAALKYVLPGYVPARPPFKRNARVMTMGSCFATTIHEALVKAGIGSTHLFLAEMVNTPPYALMMVQYLRGKDPRLVGHLGPRMLHDESLDQVRRQLPETSAFILTLGVALQPFHADGKPILEITKSTMAGFRKGMIAGDVWRMLTVDEILNYVRSTIAGMRELSPGIPIILTLSPIPLFNAVNHPSVIGRDCISKSILRVAIAMLMEEGVPNLFYWPSFEMIRWLGGHVGPFFGVDGVDHRHVSPQVIALITDLFIEHYFE
jgi:hypothetical protein